MPATQVIYNDSDKCNLCHETYGESNDACIVLPCRHQFGQTCLTTWFIARIKAGQSACCPVCRQDCDVHSYLKIADASVNPNPGIVVPQPDPSADSPTEQPADDDTQRLSCGICDLPFTAARPEYQTLNCGHKFHQKCLVQDCMFDRSHDYHLTSYCPAAECMEKCNFELVDAHGRPYPIYEIQSTIYPCNCRNHREKAQDQATAPIVSVEILPAHLERPYNVPAQRRTLSITLQRFFLQVFLGCRDAATAKFHRCLDWAELDQDLLWRRTDKVKFLVWHSEKTLQSIDAAWRFLEMHDKMNYMMLLLRFLTNTWVLARSGESASAKFLPQSIFARYKASEDSTMDEGLFNDTLDLVKKRLLSKGEDKTNCFIKGLRRGLNLTDTSTATPGIETATRTDLALAVKLYDDVKGHHQALAKTSKLCTRQKFYRNVTATILASPRVKNISYSRRLTTLALLTDETAYTGIPGYVQDLIQTAAPAHWRALKVMLAELASLKDEPFWLPSQPFYEALRYEDLYENVPGPTPSLEGGHQGDDGITTEIPLEKLKNEVDSSANETMGEALRLQAEAIMAEVQRIRIANEGRQRR